MYGGMEEYLQAFLTLALDGGEWLASHPIHFTPKERNHGNEDGCLLGFCTMQSDRY
jgi:hypothetical protein